MLKKYAQLFISALFISDSLVIFFSWLAAYFIRFKIPLVPATHGIPPFKQYVIVLIPIWLIFMINMKICNLYQPLRGKSYFREFYVIVKVVSLSVLIMTAISFFYREASFSRLVVVIFWWISTILMILAHTLVRKSLLALRKKGVYLRRVLIVGAGELAQSVAEKIDLHPEMGISVEGYLTQYPKEIGKTLKNHKIIGVADDVSKHIARENIDQLFIALPLGSHDCLERVLSHLGGETVDVKVVPDLLQFMNVHSGVEDFDGLPIVNLTGTPLYGWNSVIKRTTDIICSTFAIIITIPLMILISISIKLESSGPIIYRQRRVGLDNREFSMLKFRSMHTEAELTTGPVWTKEGDDRRTRVGKVLRHLSIDELPQLFNVIKGEMSLVGPRPERRVFVENFKKSIPHYILRLKMKAGLTGWAQVNGWRGNTSLQKRIEYDLYYIKNWSLWFDLRILIITLWKGIINRHAY